ncbi:PREDICTED: uncharacterized protein LOC108788126 [Nanorana parkeri]|uniref:uncharacterized protein LOC108788126 n=1 Tax=Nanorana parkeri TaxID=125878 RepID=UPI000854E17A|nr:PREDICTED: uncharacterized protein LOC108788126 [Nanorana parkeri]
MSKSCEIIARHGMQRLIVLSVAVSVALALHPEGVGCQRGEDGATMERASPPRVICTNTNPALLGGDVTLTCEFQAHLDVLQVTWQKKRGKDTQNMVTCSDKYGINIARPFEKHITVVNTSSVTSSIRISKLEKEDEACYNCLFNAYPNGAFTGGVCLNDLQPINEVLCNAQGNDLRIELLPPEIRMRQSVQLTKRKIGVPDVFTVKGQYTDTNINPECTFQLERAKRKKRNTQKGQKHPVEDADEVVFVQCTASGTTKCIITWHNEGQPVSQEEKVNRTGNITTVTSTLVHTVSSFPADNNMSCSISHSRYKE